MVQLTGQMGVPVIKVDGEVIIGFDRTRLGQLLARGRCKPRLGLRVGDASRLAQRSGKVPVFGAIVGSVAPSSPGEQAGLRVGDIITEINLRRISNANDLAQALASLEAGSRVTIIFLRGEETMSSEIII